MSYLTDDPISKDEEIALANAEFDYMIDNAPPDKLTNLPPSVYSISSFNPHVPRYADQLISIPIKIDLRRKPRSSFIIDMETYRHILQVLASRHGDKTPVNDQFNCLSISFVAKPNSNCCLYYRPNSDFNSKFYLIGKIKTQSKPKLFTIPCPYTDSYLTMKQSHKPPQGYSYLYFNWLYNSSAGRIIPFAYQSKFVLHESNGLMPWLCSDMYGCFLITGLMEHITFNISFVLDSRSRIEGPRQMAARKSREVRREQHMQHRHYGHKPRQTLGEPGEMQYIIPSQDYEYFTDEEDPLIKAL